MNEADSLSITSSRESFQCTDISSNNLTQLTTTKLHVATRDQLLSASNPASYDAVHTSLL